jgi:hypothetical protein
MKIKVLFIGILLSITDRHLDKARRGVSVGGLGILAKHRKKQHLITLLDSLRTIKTLVSLFTDYNIIYYYKVISLRPL